MTANPSRSAIRKRTGFLVLAGLVLAGAGFFAYHRVNRSASAPVPPNPNPEALEPAVSVAVRISRDRVLREPGSAPAWGDLGEVFLANDLGEEAQSCFAEATRLAPDNYRWPYLQAIVLMNRGDRETALPFLRRSVELLTTRDDGSGPRLMLAEVLLLLGQPKGAEPHIRAVLDRTPADPHTQFDAGLLAVATENWEAARTHFERCLGSPHARQKASIQLAAVYRRLGDDTKAADSQRDADRMPADWEWPDPVIDGYLTRAVKKRNCYRTAESLEAQGRFAEAVQLVTPVAEEYPDDDVGQLLLGRLYAQLGNFSQAEPALRRAMKLAPQKAQPPYFLSILLIQEGEKRLQLGDRVRAKLLFWEAATQARAALAIKSDYGFAHMAHGLALKHLDQPAEAATALEQAVHCSPEYAEMHLRLAEVLDQLNRRDEAAARYAQALQLAPPQTPWRATAQSRLDALQKGLKKPGG